VLVSASNLDLTEPVELTLDLWGGRFAEPTGRILTADRVDTYNDAGRPDAVTPQRLDVMADGDLVRVVIPPHAFVTVRGNRT
jgi:alpha-L-arabinofuranosidase